MSKTETQARREIVSTLLQGFTRIVRSTVAIIPMAVIFVRNAERAGGSNDEKTTAVRELLRAVARHYGVTVPEAILNILIGVVVELFTPHPSRGEEPLGPEAGPAGG